MKRMIVSLGFASFISTICISAVAQSMEATSNVIKVQLEPSTMEVTLDNLGITRLPTYHALIIGVSNYQFTGASLPNLDLPAKDAEQLSRLLVERYSFQQQHVTLLKDPTREEIINHFDLLTKKVGDRDNLLIFYAGHGYFDKENGFGYWLPADAKVASRSAWIANSTIKDYVGAIKSKHTLLITDACFGGSIFKSRSIEGVMRQFHEMYKDKSRKAMTSGNLTEVPDKSIFIHFLLKSLEENKDVILASSTLFTRIYEPILNNAPTIPQLGVIQGAGDEGGDFIFIQSQK